MPVLLITGYRSLKMANLPPIQDQTLLAQALTHRSYTNEYPEMPHNERLEFLGDAILGFTVGELLYKQYPDLSEAELTRLRSKLVDGTQLAKLANQLNLGKQMKLGKGAAKDGARENPALLSDTFEAVIGAYYLASGIEAVQHYIQDLFKPVLQKLAVSQDDDLPKQLIDVKNRLQQWSLAKFGTIPEYILVEENGPDHAKEFTFEVRIQGQFYGQGKGRKKQEATKMAAQMALSVIETRSSLGG